tara:strand:- start:373 stop:564 length:192 start_codon:yes stop_codon:yes gene_type:complete
MPNRKIRERISIGKFGALEVQQEVNKMTNWQRHQWAKVGRPVGKKLKFFVGLQKPTRLERLHG